MPSTNGSCGLLSELRIILPAVFFLKPYFSHAAKTIEENHPLIIEMPWLTSGAHHQERPYILGDVPSTVARVVIFRTQICLP